MMKHREFTQKELCDAVIIGCDFFARRMALPVGSILSLQKRVVQKFAVTMNDDDGMRALTDFIKMEYERLIYSPFFGIVHPDVVPML